MSGELKDEVCSDTEHVLFSQVIIGSLVGERSRKQAEEIGLTP